MIIESVRVEGLLGRQEPLVANFNKDLNVITGRNGAGKTTFLKLCWYLISGNVSKAISEINFDNVVIKTDVYTLRLFRDAKHTCSGSFESADGVVQKIQDVLDEDGDCIRDARDTFANLIEPHASTLFFPTFRRVEGGYTTEGRNTFARRLASRQSKNLEDALADLSRDMSSESNTFVSSISTHDIEALVLKKYTELSDQYNEIHRKVTAEVIEDISGYQESNETQSGTDHEIIQGAQELLESVKIKVQEMDVSRAAIMLPMTSIKNTVKSIFNHSGIKFGNRLSFGDAAEAISSEFLSAGEKQMLSFVCYNALTNNCVTFIDEPELSLHVDWQRSLFPTLLEQNKTNQFIIATHSPFIYTYYQEKEVCIDQDYYRGDEQYESE